ncbi:MAG TPA: hypothetical protein VMW24_03020, partial [Sedimentisphaerales bacterium]|nr:hypothetical protein [Sedimentisphaerales bacterium]
ELPRSLRAYTSKSWNISTGVTQSGSSEKQVASNSCRDNDLGMTVPLYPDSFFFERESTVVDSWR